jgi:hypothetical protein
VKGPPRGSLPGAACREDSRQSVYCEHGLPPRGPRASRLPNSRALTTMKQTFSGEIVSVSASSASISDRLDLVLMCIASVTDLT